jgi:hypothetical protein
LITLIIYIHINRRLLKDSDGDLAKFSIEMNKPKDYGYKWRTFKNIARFVKNPTGFAFWRYLYRKKQNRAPLPGYIFLSTMLAASIYQTVQHAKSKC